MSRIATLACCVVLSPLVVQAQEVVAPGEGEAPQIDIAAINEQAYDILLKHCYRCHGPGGAQDINILDRDSVIAWIEPGSPDSSDLYLSVEKDRMPKDTTRKLNRREMRIIEQWILHGAEYQTSSRTPITEEQACLAIEDDLRKNFPNEQRRRTIRYISLVHLHNNPSVTEKDMRYFRAAVSKLVNSLSRKNANIVVPVGVGEGDAILRIDLVDYDWEIIDWVEILKQYPYGLEPEDAATDSVVKRIQALYTLRAKNRLPYVRGDWFVATVSRGDGAELYHKLLRLPETLSGLEENLQVDSNQNFLRGFARNGAARAGFSESAVSKSNRMVERHTTPFGAYWKSYDFATSSVDANLFLRPLGPAFEENEFSDAFGFKHDGGEMIWNLPNGLQAYLITTSDNDRLPKAPVNIVRDLEEISGTPFVVNGISCLSCHDQGVKPFADSVRDGFRGGDRDAVRKVEDLYISADAMNALLKEDEDRFKRALEKAIGPFLKQGRDAEKDIFKFDEPIRKLAARYQLDMTVTEIAYELGKDPKDLDSTIEENRQLRDLGLGPLGENRAIKREVWHSKGRGTSVFQRAAVAFGVGVPINF